jgi:DNA-binding NarL/FixJ family response regulator
MPLTNGPEAIRVIKRRDPKTKILIHTVHESEKHIRTAFKAGADGYILKGDPYTDLLIAIRQVLQGNKYLSPGICSSVLRQYLTGSLSTEPGSPLALLTNREKEILKLIAEGLKNKEMATHLSISIKTVEKHRANIRKKLNLLGGPALTKYAIEHGLANH